MKKSIVVVGILFAVCTAALAMILRMDSTDAPPSVIAGLDALSNDKTGLPSVPQEKPEENIPVISKTGPWPKVVADELTFLFGRMQIKGHQSHPFLIRNDGEADLILNAGKTTCKCTQFDFDPSEEVNVKSAVVKPGESVVLTMSWDGGLVPDRSFRHGGEVRTNDPSQKVLTYSVEGAIEMPYDVLPQTWDVGDVFDEQPGKLTGHIASRFYENLEIESIQSPSGLVKVNAVPMSPVELEKDGYASGVALEIEVPSQITSGVFREELQISFLQMPEPVKVTVLARKHGIIRLQPMGGTAFDVDKMQVQFGSFAASQGREGKLLLIVDQKGMTEPLTISKSESDPSYLAAALSPLGEPTGTIHRYVLTLSVPPNRPPAHRTESKAGFLKLSTNCPSGESLKFDVLMYSN